MIACIAWGSLVWDPRSLPMSSNWHNDGPDVLVDYFRQSSDGRLTLVLDQSGTKCQSLWCTLAPSDLAECIQALAEREGLPSINKIGVWSKGMACPKTIPGIDRWASRTNAAHVIWTDLPPKFNNRATSPTADQVVAYLRGLDAGTSERAEEYIRRTPIQIMTRLRHVIELELQWSAV